MRDDDAVERDEALEVAQIVVDELQGSLEGLIRLVEYALPARSTWAILGARGTAAPALIVAADDEALHRVTLKALSPLSTVIERLPALGATVEVTMLPAVEIPLRRWRFSFPDADALTVESPGVVDDSPLGRVEAFARRLAVACGVPL